MAKISVLMVKGGHQDGNVAFYDAFLAMFAGDETLDVRMVEKQEAQGILASENVGVYDAVLFYDASGFAGVVGRNDSPLPTSDYERSIKSLLERGTGIVMFNHATSSWPEWPLWREIHGSSVMAFEGELYGEKVPVSGYCGWRDPNPTINLIPVDREHPVVAGLPDRFPVTDEIYLKTPRLGPKVKPLVRSDHGFVAENFKPFPSLPKGAPWNHPPGSDVMVWANAAGNSPVVASDLGDGPSAFDNPHFARLVCNMLRWAGSEEARAWARAQ